MPVVTEARVRKLFRENLILEHGIFELDKNEKLTPAAKGFLSDHHIIAVPSNLKRELGSVEQNESDLQTVVGSEDSAVCLLLFRLTELYPYFLKSQKSLHLAFEHEKCEQIGLLLTVVERMAGHCILNDLSEYNSAFLTDDDLQALRVSKQLDQERVMMAYQVPDWQLASYELYLKMTVLRKELELAAAPEDHDFSKKVCRLLKSIEVLLWLTAND